MRGISKREFAKRDGCSETLVRKRVKSGHLQEFSDGSLDPALIGSDWRPRANPPANPGCAPPANPEGVRNGSHGSSHLDPDSATPPAERGAQADPIPDADGPSDDGEHDLPDAELAHLSKAEAERIKENYLALLRKQEFEAKQGNLLPRTEVQAAVIGAFNRVRAKLLALPTKLAPIVVQTRSAAEAQQKLSDGINEALAELAATRIVSAAGGQSTGS